MNQQLSRINDALYFIHQDISAHLPAGKLAQIAAYSEQHFHRVFKQIVGESVHDYIRKVRLEYAANQLMFDPHTSVLTVAINSGFSSVSSFSRAFKAVFGDSPGRWRRVDTIEKDKQCHEGLSSKKVQKIKTPLPYELVELEARNVAYVRHQGYNKSIQQAWQTLQAWASSQGVDYSQQFGLHHSNPTLVPLEKCRYVACIEISQRVLVRSGVNTLQIPAGLHAVFRLTGHYGDLLDQWDSILSEWLPTSGLKLKSTPTYVHYIKNQFMSNDACYELDLCLPVSFY